MGFLLGIGGPITYKNSQTKEAVVKEIPLNSIFLKPIAHFYRLHHLRGTRNEPANIEDHSRKNRKNQRM